MIKWNIIVFHRNDFSLITFWYGRYEKMVPSCSPRRAGPKYLLFDLERSIWKFDLRSGQVKGRSWPKWVNMHILLSGSMSQVVWNHLRVSVSIPSRLVVEKPIVTSFDLRWPPRELRSSLAPGSGQMWWVATILKELGDFGRFMRNGKHLHISQ